MHAVSSSRRGFNDAVNMQRFVASSSLWKFYSGVSVDIRNYSKVRFNFDDSNAVKSHFSRIVLVFFITTYSSMVPRTMTDRMKKQLATIVATANFLLKFADVSLSLAFRSEISDKLKHLTNELLLWKCNGSYSP